MKTRDRIIEEALKLFSKKGYCAVSVRDIAGAVGIKESSLYNHFKNKMDIFDTIIDVCLERAEEHFRARKLPFNLSDDLSVFEKAGFDRISEMILSIFGYFFEDPYNIMFRKLLTISQFENERAGQIYRDLYRDYFLDFQTEIFRGMMKAGVLKESDPSDVARDFYGAVFMLMHTCQNFEEGKPLLLRHLRHFMDNHYQNTEAGTQIPSAQSIRKE